MPVLIKWYLHSSPSISQTPNSMECHRVSGVELRVNANSRGENCWLSHFCTDLGRLAASVLTWYSCRIWHFALLLQAKLPRNISNANW